ncbi:MAG: aminoacetone oxidase family FAD-binding enzyme [Candidatus Nealsonbacteria bacterium CG02_land_8_20_14_3_00_37_10]|uniref:Aminoacetone oxidase family FAD-binding enzyme n=2 Tax=Candidatus Nealsoniibacteriota TaxID=1817911 RepID=A0A2G9YYF6_9BACT|nr:MAG: aminoacetone oxidase family FAD-binding enzyme [Candidatus Nealsonbacteria bacterium CG23_combo_of_CG06-09_8_20_14_all_37_18]PIV45399.1 MAG: aminoacetone oxidase family FAD-binding enzyme [Candidatus Nealsonbacteria bacterium CG02_land_8_20_14_3_00_37_10]
MKNKTFFDVAVIGGGPAGLMAAGRAGELGAKVILLEKNAALARKLLLTGKGRSNITRAEFNPRELVKKYGREGNFLLYPLSIFGVKETIDFFERRGLATKVERGKRIFPQSDSSQDVLRVLIGYLRKSGVQRRQVFFSPLRCRSGVGIMTNSEVKKIVKDKNRIAKIILSSGEEILAKNYIICTGGKSYPCTGSTGDGYKWLEELGHKINKLRPALVPLKIKENWPKIAQGLSLKNVELTVFRDNKKQDSRFGEMLFTHFGVSGPIVLDLSGKIGQLLERGEVKLVLDLKPALDFQTLDKRLRSDFSKYSRKLFKNSLSDLLPQKLIPVIIELSGINPEKKVNEITREERQKLVKLLKGLEMTVSSLLGFETAIVTSGGVSLKEIDSKTMKSKLVENLFLAGEIIDLHGLTGGYNLQLCWSTGYLAGQSAVKF